MHTIPCLGRTFQDVHQIGDAHRVQVVSGNSTSLFQERIAGVARCGQEGWKGYQAKYAIGITSS
jgi:hypothetical protein